jgi:hypothetical protein
MSRGRAAAAALLALSVGGCGPYAEVAQKLDVTARVAGDTWIAAGPADRTELRLLLVAQPDADGTAPFAFSALQMPVARGAGVLTLQGQWREVAGGATTLQIRHVYTLPDESGVSLLSRRGAYREDVDQTVRLAVARTGERLAISGDDRLAGTYVPLGAALSALGGATGRDATCAFHLANLGLRSSEARIIGFGGPGMTQYRGPETFVGTVAGSLRVAMSGATTHPLTTITYSAFEDWGGQRVDGPQMTDVNSGGDGHMSGVLTFALTPVSAGGTPGAAITGTVDYGGGANAADAVQIANGTAVGGVYVVTLDGGGAARVSPQDAPSPSVSECLALP